MTNTGNLKSDLINLKTKLDTIEKSFEIKLKDVEQKETKFKDIEGRLNELVDTKDKMINLNIGGKIFQTKISTLMSIKDTLFYKLIMSHLEDNSSNTEPKEIFFDRSYEHFALFLNFLRTKKYSLKGYDKFQLDDILIEADYYGISEISNFLIERCKEIEIIGFQSAPQYSTIGTHRFEDLSDRSLTKGICVQSPYHITIELNFEHEIDEIEIGGFNGNTSMWYPGNGGNAKILTSTNGVDFTEVGVIPSNYGATIQLIKLKSSLAKFIKFQSTSYLGIGFLNFKRTI